MGVGRNRRALRTSESGAALVEFAVVLPVLLLILLGILDFGRAMNYFNDATQMANEGARWAAVNRNPGSSTLAQYILEQADTTELRDHSQVCISFPTGSSRIGDPVRVTVTTDFSFLPFLDLASVTMRGEAVMRLEQLPSNYSAECSSS